MSKEVFVSARPTITLCSSSTPASANVETRQSNQQRSSSSASTVPFVSTAVSHEPLSHGTENSHIIAREIAKLNAKQKRKNNKLTEHRKFLAQLSQKLREKAKNNQLPPANRGRKGCRRAWALSREDLLKKAQQEEEKEEDDLLNFTETLNIDSFEQEFETLQEGDDNADPDDPLNQSFLDRQHESIEKYKDRAAIKEDSKVYTFRNDVLSNNEDTSWDPSTKVDEPIKVEAAKDVLPKTSLKIHSKASLSRVISKSESDDGPQIVIHDKEDVGEKKGR
ncbi:hypothetical protein GEMRC1_014196 [Eukaryota sp. GEM-RC1]